MISSGCAASSTKLPKTLCPQIYLSWNSSSRSRAGWLLAAVGLGSFIPATPPLSSPQLMHHLMMHYAQHSNKEKVQKKPIQRLKKKKQITLNVNLSSVPLLLFIKILHKPKIQTKSWRKFNCLIFLCFLFLWKLLYSLFKKGQESSWTNLANKRRSFGPICQLWPSSGNWVGPVPDRQRNMK